jgi:hypothetical protein
MIGTITIPSVTTGGLTERRHITARTATDATRGQHVGTEISIRIPVMELNARSMAEPWRGIPRKVMDR